jgi:hypothetical protein
MIAVKSILGNTGPKTEVILCTMLSGCLSVTVALLAEADNYPQSSSATATNVFNVHGFASQSYIDTTKNQFFGESEDGSWEFLELGVNGLWKPVDGLQLALQVVVRDAGATDSGEARIDYGLLDYALVRSQNNVAGLRLGRIMNPYGFYNDTRDIAATRPSILLPQSIYFDVNRNLALSSDGIQFYQNFSNTSGDYLLQLGVFEPRTADPALEPAIFFIDAPGKLKGTTSWMGRLIYEYDFGLIRLGLTASEVNVDYKTNALDPVTPGEFHFSPYILSAQYNAENWNVTAEYAYRKTALSEFHSPINVEFTGTSSYVQGVYHLNNHWRFMLRYDELIWNSDDSDGSDFSAATGLPGHSRFAKDWTVGVHWDIAPNVMLRVEWHKVNGTGWISLLENPSLANLEQHWELFAASASFQF